MLDLLGVERCDPPRSRSVLKTKKKVIGGRMCVRTCAYFTVLSMFQCEFDTSGAVCIGLQFHIIQSLTLN